MFAENDIYDEYSNCENGIVSFQKMFRKFFSKEIKEYFSFDGTYSRLEYFYSQVIIYIALCAVIVPFTAAPELYVVVAVPVFVAFVWLLSASYVKRLKDIGVSLWVMLIPPICGLFIKGDEYGDGGAVLGWFILSIYQLFVFFSVGQTFQNEENLEETFKELKTDVKDVLKFGCASAGAVLIIPLLAALLFLQ